MTVHDVIVERILQKQTTVADVVAVVVVVDCDTY